DLLGVEVEEELPGLGLPAALAVPRDDPPSVGVDAEAGERPAADLAAERAEHGRGLPQGGPPPPEPPHRPPGTQVDEVEPQPPAAIALRAQQPGANALPEPRRGHADDPCCLSGVEVDAGAARAPRCHLLLVRATAKTAGLASADRSRRASLRGR